MAIIIIVIIVAWLAYGNCALGPYIIINHIILYDTIILIVTIVDAAIMCSLPLHMFDHQFGHLIALCVCIIIIHYFVFVSFFTHMMGPLIIHSFIANHRG
jgi:hypothetical protein